MFLLKCRAPYETPRGHWITAWPKLMDRNGNGNLVTPSGRGGVRSAGNQQIPHYAQETLSAAVKY